MFVCAAMTLATSVPCCFCFCSLFMCARCILQPKARQKWSQNDGSLQHYLETFSFIHLRKLIIVSLSVSLSLFPASVSLSLCYDFSFIFWLSCWFILLLSFHFLAFSGTRIECDEHVVLWCNDYSCRTQTRATYKYLLHNGKLLFICEPPPEYEEKAHRCVHLMTFSAYTTFTPLTHKICSA